MTALETILYGNTGVDPRLPLPDEIAALFAADAPTPLVLSTSVPINSAPAVAVGSSVVLTFNNKISKESIVVVSEDGTLVSGTETWDGAGKVYTFKPTTNLTAATTYLIVVEGVSDIYGQVLNTTVNKFTTA